jgi:hypothetical protein
MELPFGDFLAKKIAASIVIMANTYNSVDEITNLDRAWRHKAG